VRARTGVALGSPIHVIHQPGSYPVSQVKSFNLNTHFVVAAVVVYLWIVSAKRK